MTRLWKKVDDDLLGSPEETMGFSKELLALKQNFLIKKYDFSSIEQVEEIKKKLKLRESKFRKFQFQLKRIKISNK